MALKKLLYICKSCIDTIEGSLIFRFNKTYKLEPDIDAKIYKAMISEQYQIINHWRWNEVSIRIDEINYKFDVEESYLKTDQCNMSLSNRLAFVIRCAVARAAKQHIKNSTASVNEDLRKKIMK